MFYLCITLLLRINYVYNALQRHFNISCMDFEAGTLNPVPDDPTVSICTNSLPPTHHTQFQILAKCCMGCVHAPFKMILCDYQSHPHIILWFKKFHDKINAERFIIGKKKLRVKKICPQYYGSDTNRELYIKGAGSHLLEPNNSCDMCRPSWPGETIKRVWRRLKEMTWCQQPCLPVPRNNKKRKEKNDNRKKETIIIYISLRLSFRGE